MNVRLLLVAASAAATTLLSAHAVTYGNYQLEGWVGSGSNASVCVFDFGATEYAFGYRYDDTKTGADMLAALNGSFGIAVSYDPKWGTASTISYNGYTMTTGVAAEDGHSSALFTYCSGGYAVNDWVDPVVTTYYTGGGTNGPTWAFAETGFTSRYLTNGSWDGWIQGTYKGMTAYSAAPDGAFASVAIPEPAALALLAVGALALFRQRR